MNVTFALSKIEIDALEIMKGDAAQHIQQLAEAEARQALRGLHHRRRLELEDAYHAANPLSDEDVIAHYRRGN